jgi:hypothetical protein
MERVLAPTLRSERAAGDPSPASSTSARKTARRGSPPFRPHPHTVYGPKHRCTSPARRTGAGPLRVASRRFAADYDALGVTVHNAVSSWLMRVISRAMSACGRGALLQRLHCGPSQASGMRMRAGRTPSFQTQAQPRAAAAARAASSTSDRSSLAACGARASISARCAAARRAYSAAEADRPGRFARQRLR